ncbi:MAG: hypothetical protein IJS80_01035 [Lachnospiraceae bacterium]|nr:hypothetical protein [Lachnospiraceae bacterium]
MINYDEEIKKFQPSLEVEEAEETILHTDMSDIADVIEKLMVPKEAKNR